MQPECVERGKHRVPELHAAASTRHVGELALGVGRRLFGVADHAAVAEADEPRGEAGHIRLVGHDHDGGALAIEFLHERHQFERGAAVERAGRLVGEQHLGVVHQRAGDGDALLLAAGELGRPVFHPLGESHAGQRLGGLGTALGAGHAGIDHGQLDIAERIEPLQQVELLKHESDLAVAQVCQRIA